MRLSLIPVALALAIAASGCGDSKPPITVDGKVKVEAGVDAAKDTTPTIDVKQADKKFVWPDIAPPKDTWPWPKSDYTGTPFGCYADTDCFGQKCCPTPWGVKLCAPSCEVK